MQDFLSDPQFTGEMTRHINLDFMALLVIKSQGLDFLVAFEGPVEGSS